MLHVGVDPNFPDTVPSVGDLAARIDGIAVEHAQVLRDSGQREAAIEFLGVIEELVADLLNMQDLLEVGATPAVHAQAGRVLARQQSDNHGVNRLWDEIANFAEQLPPLGWNATVCQSVTDRDLVVANVVRLAILKEGGQQSPWAALGPAEVVEPGLFVRRDEDGFIAVVNFRGSSGEFHRMRDEGPLSLGAFGSPTLTPEVADWTWTSLVRPTSVENCCFPFRVPDTCSTIAEPSIAPKPFWSSRVSAFNPGAG